MLAGLDLAQHAVGVEPEIPRLCGAALLTLRDLMTLDEARGELRQVQEAAGWARMHIVKRGNHWFSMCGSSQNSVDAAAHVFEQIDVVRNMIEHKIRHTDFLD